MQCTCHKSNCTRKFAHIKAAKQEQTKLAPCVSCEPAQSKCTRTRDKYIFIWNFTERMPPSRVSISIKHRLRPLPSESLHADTLYRQKHTENRKLLYSAGTTWRETNGETHPKNRTPLVDKWKEGQVGKKQKQREKQTYTDRTTTTLQSHRLPSPQLKGKKIETCMGPTWNHQNPTVSLVFITNFMFVAGSRCLIATQ